MPSGPKPKYTDTIADEICSRMAEGESLRAICRSHAQDEEWPTAGAVCQWLADADVNGEESKFNQFAKQYARSRAIQADAMFDEIFDIADDGGNDWVEREGSEKDQELYRLNGEHVQRSRLRVDTRKWALSKMLPKKYGDKLTLGGDDENPLSITLSKHVSDL